MDKLLEALRTIKNNNGQWIDFIEGDTGLIENNYESCMTVLNWHPEINSEKEFDNAMNLLFNSL